MIGTGCSAAQFAPIVAEQVAHLEIFQRTPNWLFPVPHYRHEVPQGFQYLLGHVPYYRQWYRFWLFWKSAELLRPMAEVDPDWPDQSRSVGEGNDLLRQLLTEAIEAQYAERPDLLEKVIPQYPPAAKRIIVDDGAWAATLHRDNVTLTTTGIDKIVPEGVVTVDGELHEFDVLLYGTGFQPSKFLTPMKVVGRGGVELHERWDGNARAYLGVTVPGFPNFFMLYGPNTNIVVNGSIIWFTECEVRYVMDCIRTVLAGDHRALDVKADVHDALQRGDRRREPAHGVGRLDRQQLVQERQRAGRPELAVPAARVLEAHPRGRPRRLRSGVRASVRRTVGFGPVTVEVRFERALVTTVGTEPAQTLDWHAAAHTDACGQPEQVRPSCDFSYPLQVPGDLCCDTETKTGWRSESLLADRSVDRLAQEVDVAVVAARLLHHVDEDPAQAERPAGVPVARHRQRVEVAARRDDGGPAAVARRLVQRHELGGVVEVGRVEVPVAILTERRAGPRLGVGAAEQADLEPVVLDQRGASRARRG